MQRQWVVESDAANWNHVGLRGSQFVLADIIIFLSLFRNQIEGIKGAYVGLHHNWTFQHPASFTNICIFFIKWGDFPGSFFFTLPPTKLCSFGPFLVCYISNRKLTTHQLLLLQLIRNPSLQVRLSNLTWAGSCLVSSLKRKLLITIL